MGQIIALLPKFACLAVDNKVIYQCKRGFFVGICIEKGARFFVIADTVDTTVVSAVSATTGHDRRVPNHFQF